MADLACSLPLHQNDLPTLDTNYKLCCKAAATVPATLLQSLEALYRKRKPANLLSCTPSDILLQLVITDSACMQQRKSTVILLLYYQVASTHGQEKPTGGSSLRLWPLDLCSIPYYHCHSFKPSCSSLGEQVYTQSPASSRRVRRFLYVQTLS